MFRQMSYDIGFFFGALTSSDVGLILLPIMGSWAFLGLAVWTLEGFKGKR